MTEESAFLSGEVETTLRLTSMAARLNAHRIAAQVRESSHFEGGRYLLIGDQPGHLMFEAVADGGYLVEGDGDSVSQVLAMASRVSLALADLQIRYRFEIYDQDDEMAEHLHFHRPSDAPEMTG